MQSPMGVFPDQAPRSVGLGTFDGLHPGHLRVLDRAWEEAGREDLRSSVLTFQPEPQAVLRDQKPTDFRLLDLDLKQELLFQLGFDEVLEVEFSEELADWPAERFGRWLMDSGNAQHVSVGYDFRYGRKRSGSTQTLREQFNQSGRRVSVCSPVKLDGQPVGSSPIREALRTGIPERARRLMGRPYLVRETVQPGKGRGREIGFPTLNLPVERTIHPADGVYFVWTGPNLDKPGVANFGTRPTVAKDSKRWLEVHLLEAENPPSAGDQVQVALAKHHRGEQDFGSVDALTEQIQRDKSRAEDWFRDQSPPNWPDWPDWVREEKSLAAQG